MLVSGSPGFTENKATMYMYIHTVIIYLEPQIRGISVHNSCEVVQSIICFHSLTLVKRIQQVRKVFSLRAVHKDIYYDGVFTFLEGNVDVSDIIIACHSRASVGVRRTVWMCVLIVLERVTGILSKNH